VSVALGTVVVQRRGRVRQLQAAEASIREILDATPDALLGVDTTGRIILANTAAENLFGFSHQELIGLSVDALVPESLRERHATHRKTFMVAPGARPMGLGLKLVGMRKDGLSFPVEISLNHLRWGHEDVVLAAIRDVTELRHAETALRESEARLVALADATFAVVWRVDDRGRPVGDNSSWLAFTGQTEHDMMSGRWADVVHPGDRERLDDALSRVLAEGVPRRVETRLRHVEGGWRDMVVRAAPIRDDDGAVVELAVAAVDVTERKLAEETLRASEARLKETQRVARLGSWELDLLTNRLTWSEEVYRLFELDTAEFGASYEAFLDAIHPDDRVMVDLAYATSVRNKVPYDITHRLRMADGRIKFVSERCETFYDDEDRPLRSVGTVLDITERQVADEAARRARERTHALFQGVPSPLFAWEKKGDDFILTDFNDAANVFTKGRAADLMGKPASNVYGDRPDIVSDMERCFNERTSFRREMEYRFSTADLQLMLTVTYAYVAPNVVLVHVEDITDRKQQHLKLEQSEKDLRDLTAHLDTVREEERANMARNLHDDLGQTLTALKMDLRALRRRVAQGRKMSPASLDAADQFVDALLATGRRVVSELRAPPLEGLGLRESLESQAAEFVQRSGAHCDVTCTPADLRVDDRTALLLYRILQESLTNVARHAAATAVTVTLRAGQDDLVLLVEDNGRGLSPKPAAKKQFGIIGMRERARALGGRFEIRGGARGGTVVEVVVPAPVPTLAEDGT
jgi:PAS domain S-box-containing protein